MNHTHLFLDPALGITLCGYMGPFSLNPGELCKYCSEKNNKLTDQFSPHQVRRHLKVEKQEIDSSLWCGYKSTWIDAPSIPICMKCFARKNEHYKIDSFMKNKFVHIKIPDGRTFCGVSTKNTYITTKPDMYTQQILRDRMQDLCRECERRLAFNLPPHNPYNRFNDL